MFPWRVKPETPVSADCKFLKLKEVTYSVGAVCRGGLSLRKAEKHFNIANNDLQVFFFVGTFVEFETRAVLKAPANSCAR